MDIVLYGAGIRGKKIENILFQNGIVIKGFADTYKRGIIECFDGRKYPIFSLSELAGRDNIVIVAIANQDEYFKVANMLKEQQIDVTPVEDVLKNKNSVVERNREFIAEYHLNGMDDWYKDAEQRESLNTFWKEDSIFFKMFNELNLDKIVELACGHGRHVPYYADTANEIMLVDVLQSNIDFCKQRFCKNEKVNYYCNNGHDLHDISDASYTSLFTYDAMVHFEMLDIFEYLKETYRILGKGGRALLHHSNNHDDYRITFSTGTGGRNYMSKDLFAYLANRAGFKVLEQQVIDWGGVKNLDCLSLVEKS